MGNNNLNKNVIPIISKNPLVDFYKIVSLFYPASSLDNENINIEKNLNKFQYVKFHQKI